MPVGHGSVPHGDGISAPLLRGGWNGVWTCQLVWNDCVRVSRDVGGGVLLLVVKDWA